MTTQTATSATGYFPAEALETNRRGKLTDEQRRNLAGSERAFRKNELVAAVMAAIVGVLILMGNGPAAKGAERLLFGLGMLAVAAFFLVRSLTGDAVARDLADTQVVQVEGALEKRIVNVDTGPQGHGPSEFYWVHVAGQKFEVSGAAYHALPEAGWVRLFVLQKSHKLVNFERLPDKPLPAGALDSPMDALGTLMRAVRSHDTETRAEANAELAALERIATPQVEHDVSPPAAADRDSRPLAEALVGTWRSGFIALTFGADGTLVRKTGGIEARGRWSVDADGRVRAEGMGLNQSVEAWVKDGALTIAFGGEALTLQRTV